MGEQQAFEFSWRHLETLVLNEFLQSVNDEHVPVFIKVSNVAGVQPAIGIDGFGGGLVVVQVTLHDLWTAHPQLTIAADIAVVTFEIDNAALGVRDGHARGTSLVLETGRCVRYR